MLPVMQLSQKVSSIPEALSVYINNLVYAMKHKGDRVITLSLGEAFFEIPALGFDADMFRKGCHYSESRGLPELRNIICNYYREHYGANVDPQKEIIISAGSKPLIYMAFQAVLNQGDEVLIHEPAWLSYPEEVKLANGVPLFIPYDCPVQKFPDYFTPNTRMVVLSNPNNPAGRIYTPEELTELYGICRSRGIYILADEAYSDFVIDGSFASLGRIVPDKDGIIIVNSLSKNLGVSGWRIGYVISSPAVIFNILKLNQHLITCAPTVLAMYLAKHFSEIVRATLPQAHDVVKKRSEIQSYIRAKGLDILSGSATFYLFVSTGSYKYSSLDLALYLLAKYRIAVVPGSAYGKSTANFIRIGVGAESMSDIQRAIDTISGVISRNEFDDAFIAKELEALGMNRFQEEVRQ